MSYFSYYKDNHILQFGITIDICQIMTIISPK